MSVTNLSRFDDLVSRYIDDALTDTDAAELVALLAEPPLAARLLEMTRLNSEIAGLLAAPVPDAAMVELVRTDIGKIMAGNSARDDVRLRIAERTQPHASAPAVVSAPRPVPRPTKPVWRALAWAAAFLVLAGLAAIFLANRTRLTDAPVVVSVQGEARLVASAGERVPLPGESWPRDEKLKTLGRSSAASVRFRDGSQLDFGGDTVAVIQSDNDGPRVVLEHGLVKAVVKKMPAPRPFIFVTQEAEAIVVGTTLRLVAGAHLTRLEVTEGEVRFRRRHDGAEVAVRSGHYAVVAPNVPFAATPFHSDPHHLQ